MPRQAQAALLQQPLQPAESILLRAGVGEDRLVSECNGVGAMPSHRVAM
jgi:hypothetical protein